MVGRLLSFLGWLIFRGELVNFQGVSPINRTFHGFVGDLQNQDNQGAWLPTPQRQRIHPSLEQKLGVVGPFFLGEGVLERFVGNARDPGTDVKR